MAKVKITIGQNLYKIKWPKKVINVLIYLCNMKPKQKDVSNGIGISLGVKVYNNMQ